jgi:hypothetical protein
MLQDLPVVQHRMGYNRPMPRGRKEIEALVGRARGSNRRYNLHLISAQKMRSIFNSSIRLQNS